jgi:hypothetical protein
LTEITSVIACLQQLRISTPARANWAMVRGGSVYATAASHNSALDSFRIWDVGGGTRPWEILWQSPCGGCLWKSVTENPSPVHAKPQPRALRAALSSHQKQALSCHCLPLPAGGECLRERSILRGSRGQPARQYPSTTSTPLHPRPTHIGRLLISPESSEAQEPTERPPISARPTG